MSRRPSLRERLLASLAALVMGLCACASAAAERELRIGVEGAYPPFSQVDPDGSLSGFDIDIARALCRQMRVRCVLVQQTFDGLIPALDAHKIDAVVASLSITAERRQAVDFTDKYYKTPGRLVARRDAHLLATPEGLAGRRIGVQRASSYDRYATDTFGRSEIRRYAKQDDVFLDLTAGRLDAALCDSVAAYVGFLHTPAGQDYAFVGEPFLDAAYFGDGAGIAVRKGDSALREELNAAIAALRADGTYARIQAAYVDFDLYSDTSAAAAAAPLQAYIGSLLRGAGVTLSLAFASLSLAVVVGLAAMAARLSRRRVWRIGAQVYTTLVRSVPDLVLMLLVFYGGHVLVNAVLTRLGLGGVDIDPFVAGVFTLGLIFGAYFAETFRGAYLSVPAGQQEAALAFGMSRWQSFRRIVGPQMLRHALAPLLNNWLVLLKSTAIVSVIGLTDMMQRAGLAAGATRAPFLYYGVVALLYLAMTAASQFAVAALARRLEVGVRKETA